jgi:hypothetical protein
MTGGPRHYRRRATFLAMQWTGADDLAPVSNWFGAENVRLDGDRLTLNGATLVQQGQWIVLSPNNRLHICQPGLFEEVHELALADPPDTPAANMAAGLAAARAASNYWKTMAQMLAAKAGVELPQPPAAPVSGE